MALASVRTLAKAMNVSTRRVSQLVHLGLPREEHGRYDLGQCLMWYIRYLQRVLEGRQLGTADCELFSLTRERLALLRAKRELRELELAEKRKQFVADEGVDEAIAEMVLTMKPCLMGLPARLGAELVGETSRAIIEAKIDREVRGALPNGEGLDV